jgi:hypothetical protein
MDLACSGLALCQLAALAAVMATRAAMPSDIHYLHCLPDGCRMVPLLHSEWGKHESVSFQIQLLFGYCIKFDTL